jgi:hypothetical protein
MVSSYFLKSLGLIFIATPILYSCGSGGGGGGNGGGVSSTGNNGNNGNNGGANCTNSISTIFDDCLSTSWAMSMVDNAQGVNIISQNSSTENARWTVLNLMDGVHNNVIDVEYLHLTNFADFNLKPISGNGLTVDELTAIEELAPDF